jgi:hypothetical protein
VGNRETRVAELEHAVAISRGDVGTRGGEVPYLTLHGGLGVALDELGLVKEELLIQADQVVNKANRSVINRLTATIATAQFKGDEAVRAVNQLHAQGNLAGMATMRGEVARLNRQMIQMEQALLKRQEVACNLGNYIQQMPTTAG